MSRADFASVVLNTVKYYDTVVDPHESSVTEEKKTEHSFQRKVGCFSMLLSVAKTDLDSIEAHDKCGDEEKEGAVRKIGYSQPKFA